MKPRLNITMRYDNTRYWHCHADGHHGLGKTPAEAYVRWYTARYPDWGYIRLGPLPPSPRPATQL